MTIDEAIEKSKELASTYRIAAKNAENIFISKLMQETKRKIYIKLAEEHEQLAEWLEELRELRVTVSELQCEMQATGALLNERDKETRNNAIDDFAEKLNAKCDGMINDKWNSNVAPVSWAEAYADFKDDIDEMAEQLKAG